MLLQNILVFYRGIPNIISIFLIEATGHNVTLVGVSALKNNEME